MSTPNKCTDKWGRYRLNRIYSAMKSRCHNPNHYDYKYYGARGISVCDEWRNSYKAFKVWALSNGYRDDLTIDRFPDKQGNYEPGNCRWATMQEQNRNKSKHYIMSSKPRKNKSKVAA